MALEIPGALVPCVRETVLLQYRSAVEALHLAFGAEGEPPGEVRRARVFVGYAGWGPGQLESELEEDSWIVEPALADDVFTSEPDELWSEVLRRKGGPFGVLAQMPLDPSLN